MTGSLRAALALLIAVSGCAILGRDTHGTRERARPLALGEWHRDFLHCDRRECSDWYAIDVAARGVLRVDVYSPTEATVPSYSLRLENEQQEQLAELPPSRKSPRQLRRPIEPGRYLVQVHAEGELDARLEYEILAEWQREATPGATPAPPRAPEPRLPPAAEWIDAALLEVEREGGRPRFVLIDRGAPHGVRVGCRGQLVARQRDIAEIEVVEVYEAGSRARILGDPPDDITAETGARIALPVAE